MLSLPTALLAGGLLLATLQPGCKRDDGGPVDGAALLRERLFYESKDARSAFPVARAKQCFLEHPAYCVRDEDVVEPMIRNIVATEHGGQMPAGRNDVLRMLGRLRKDYTAYLHTSDGIARVEARVRALYENPTRHDGVDEVRTDVGFLPFAIGTDGERFRVESCALLDEGQVRSVELGKVLERLVARDPEIKRLHLVARLPVTGPDGIVGRPLHVWYAPATRGLTLAEGDGATVPHHRTTLPEGGLAGVVAGNISLRREHLEPCHPSESDDCLP